MRSLMLFCLLTGLSYSVTADQNQEFDPQKYYTLKSAKTVEVKLSKKKPTLTQLKQLDIQSLTPKSLSLADQKCVEASQKGLSAANLDLSMEDLNKVVAIGKQIWKIVEENQPVVNLQTDAVAVVPLKAECWRWLEGWKNPVVKTFRTTYKNLYGIKVVDFQYKLIYYYGGSYRGQGKYLARVAVVPEVVDLAWGYELNAAVTAPTVLNYGTVVDPIAAVELEMQYSVKTPLKHSSSTVNFLVKGNGEGFVL